jgi:hypothetical protein
MSVLISLTIIIGVNLLDFAPRDGDLVGLGGKAWRWKSGKVMQQWAITRERWRGRG